MRNPYFVVVLAASSAMPVAAHASASKPEATAQAKVPCVVTEAAPKYLAENGYMPAWTGTTDQKNKAIQNTFIIMAKNNGDWIALNAPTILGHGGTPKSEIVCISGHGTKAIGRNLAESMSSKPAE
jgi:hypothetical protein